MNKPLTSLFVLGLLLLPSFSFALPVTPENILNGVNEERARLGLSTLTRSTYLDTVAQNKLTDIVEYGYFAHDNPITGEKAFKFFADAEGQYHYNYSNENLACGHVFRPKDKSALHKCLNTSHINQYPSTEALVNAWINSAGHYRNIKNPLYQETGIAMNGNLTIQVFAGRAIWTGSEL